MKKLIAVLALVLTLGFLVAPELADATRYSTGGGDYPWDFPDY